MELNVLAPTFRIALQRDFKIFACNFQRRHELAEVQRKGKIRKCQLLLAWAANGEHLKAVLPDEKIFCAVVLQNDQNTCELSPTSDLAHAVA